MSVDSYCNIWYTNNPYTAPEAGTKVINGRSRVYAIWVCSGRSGIAEGSQGQVLSCPIVLRTSSGGSILYEAAFMAPSPNSEADNGGNFHTYTHYFGGNGILFPDEVWYGVRDNDVAGSSAEPNIFVGIIYSGGANA
jgi:hypothetical protein